MQIDVENLAHRGRVEVEHGAVDRIGADVVDQVVDTPEGLQGLRHDLVLVACVVRLASHADGGIRAEIRHRLGERFGIAAGDADLVASLHQRLGDGEPDAAAGSGDDGGPGVVRAVRDERRGRTASGEVGHGVSCGRDGKVRPAMCTPGAMYARDLPERKVASWASYGLTIPLTGVAAARAAGAHRLATGPRLHRCVVGRVRWFGRVHPAWPLPPLGRRRCAWERAIVPAFTRGAPTIAQSAAALADAAPGRVALGIGTSSNVIVEKWNGIPFDKPYERVRDVVRFLRVALTGQKVTQTYETFTVDGFRLLLVPEIQPKLLIAALRPGMLRLAGREADGAIINWLAADDVPKVAPYVHQGGPDKEIVARIFVCPDR